MTNEGLGARLIPLAAALVVVWWPFTWAITRHAVTVVHEGAHGLVGAVCGRSISGIRLHPDSSGLTVTRGRPRGPGMVATLFAGYVGPGLLGLALAGAVAAGRAVWVLWGLLILVALVLLQIRNLYGLWVVVVAGAVLGAVTHWANPDQQRLAAYVITWFYLLAAPRGITNLWRARRRSRGPTSDPDQLAAITPLPAVAWIGLMLAVDLGCFALGAVLLLSG